MKSHSFAAMPALDFNCCVTYLTPAGHRRTAHLKTRATLADTALVVAERQLRSDRRRHVGIITYGEAIEQ